MPNGRSDFALLNGNGDPLLSYHVAPEGNFAACFDSEHYQVDVPVDGVAVTDFTQYGYDGPGNLGAIMDARGEIRTFGYDSRGNRTSSRDARGFATTFTYDGSSRLTRIQNEEGHAVNYAYDDHDNRTQVSTAAGTVDMTYDDWDRLRTTVTGDPGQRHTTTFS